MGDFRIAVEALGGHGCMRDVGDEGFVMGCNRVGCPDCLARELVRRLQRAGCTIHKAELTHWPHDFVPPGGGQSNYSKENEVVDNLVTGQRSGSF